MTPLGQQDCKAKSELRLRRGSGGSHGRNSGHLKTNDARPTFRGAIGKSLQNRFPVCRSWFRQRVVIASGHPRATTGSQSAQYSGEVIQGLLGLPVYAFRGRSRPSPPHFEALLVHALSACGFAPQHLLERRIAQRFIARRTVS